MHGLKINLRSKTIYFEMNKRYTSGKLFVYMLLGILSFLSPILPILLNRYRGTGNLILNSTGGVIFYFTEIKSERSPDTSIKGSEILFLLIICITIK